MAKIVIIIDYTPNAEDYDEALISEYERVLVDVENLKSGDLRPHDFDDMGGEVTYLATGDDE